MASQKVRSNFTVIALALVAASMLWAVTRVGLSTIPGIATAADSAFGWPFKELSQYSAFSATSPIGSLIFTVIGNSDPVVFLGLHVVALVVALVLTLWWVAALTPRSSRLMAFRLVILSPWVALLLIFLGSYDPFTVIGFALVLLSWTYNKTLLILLAGVILGFQHFEQSVFALLAAYLVVVALPDRLPPDFVSPKKILFTLSGLISGKLALTLILTLSSESGAFGRGAFWTAEWFRISFVTSVNFWAVFLLSLFAGSWGLIVVVSLSVRRKQQAILFVAFLLCLIPAVLTLDHTRVFVMTSMLSLSIITVAFARSIDLFSSRDFVYVEVLAWLVVPLSVWVGMDGTPYLHNVGSLDQLIIFYNQVTSL
jgi:hypothetical protein